jgi:hypothetical protein
VGFFIAFFLMYLSLALMITRVARVLDCELFMFIYSKYYGTSGMQCFINTWRVTNLLMMVLRLNKSLKYRELIPTADCSGPAPTLVPFYSEYTTPRVSSTIPGKTRFCCPAFPCWKMFTSDSWRLKYIQLQHPEYVQVAHQKNVTVSGAPRRIEPAQRRGININKDSVGVLQVFPKLEQFEHIATSESEPLPSPLPRAEPYPSAGVPLSN